MMKAASLIVFLSFFSLGLFGQYSTEHWIPPFFAKPGPETGTSNIRDHFVKLTTFESAPFNVTIEDGFGNLIDVVQIADTSSGTYEFSPQGNASSDSYPLNVIPVDSLNMKIRSQGLHFKADLPFYVEIMHTAGSHGLSMFSKGKNAKGQRFYSGHIYTVYNQDEIWNEERRSHFISVMATEDDTEITFDLIKNPIYYVGHWGEDEITITLDANESYVLGVDHADFDNETINNSIGTRISSDKDIVCNSGSWLAGLEVGQDIGADQLAPVKYLGSEYVVVRGEALQSSGAERVIIVGVEEDTEVFINDELSEPVFSLGEGEVDYLTYESFNEDGVLRIESNQPIYVFQFTSGTSINGPVDTGLAQVPPLKCAGIKEYLVSEMNYNVESLCRVILKSESNLFINGELVPEEEFKNVDGNEGWKVYREELDSSSPTFSPIHLESDSAMIVSALYSHSNLGALSYFNGFGTEPEVGLYPVVVGDEPCAPGNAIMAAFGFENYQWYIYGEPILGGNSSALIPQFSGGYQVEGIDEVCGNSALSDTAVVPLCPSGLGISLSPPEVNQIGETAEFDLAYTATILNGDDGVLGSAIQNIQIIDDIMLGLPLGATAEVVGSTEIVQGPLSGFVNEGFNGGDDLRVLSGSGDLVSGGTATIEFTVRVNMENAVHDGYYNQLIVNSNSNEPNDGVTGPFEHQDYSNVGTNPDSDQDGILNETADNSPLLTCFYSNEVSYAYDSLSNLYGGQFLPTINGIEVGSFSSSPEGLAIDSLTGEIDVNSSELGVYEILYSVGGRCSSTTAVEMVIVDTELSAREASVLEYRVFPNPTEGHVNVRIECDRCDQIQFEVIDVLGRRIMSESMNHQMQSFFIEGPSGIYIYRIKRDKVQVGQGKLILN